MKLPFRLLSTAGFVLAAALLLASCAKTAQELPVVTVYQSPTCGCCSKWVTHLEQNGFTVNVTMLPDVSPMKGRYAIPHALTSCHTATVGGYAVEGHVPASDIKRMLAQRPAISGIAVPGMPAGSPGMESSTPVPYRVIAFTGDGRQYVFANH
jgi:hypothetical protein